MSQRQFPSDDAARSCVRVAGGLSVEPGSLTPRVGPSFAPAVHHQSAPPQLSSAEKTAASPARSRRAARRLGFSRRCGSGFTVSSAASSAYIAGSSWPLLVGVLVDAPRPAGQPFTFFADATLHVEKAMATPFFSKACYWSPIITKPLRSTWVFSELRFGPMRFIRRSKR
jgi:hypothetical protein